MELLKTWKIFGMGIAIAMAPSPGLAADGQILKLELQPGKDRTMLVVTHSGAGKFRIFKSETQRLLIVEAENLHIPPALTKMVDVTEGGGPILQMTPYNSSHGGHSMAKLVLQLRNTADVVSSELPGKFLVEIKKQAWAMSPNAKGALNTEKDALKTHLSALEKSEEVAQKLIDVLDAEPENKKYFGSRVTFEAKDAEVPDIFRLVGESSNLNIIWDAEVEGQKTSLAIKDLPWDQLLDLVIQQKGYKAMVMGNVVRIMTLEAYNRHVETKAKAKELSITSNIEPVIMAVIPMSFTDAGTMRALISSLIPASASSDSSGLDAAIKKAGGFNRGKVEVDSRTNSLVVTDTKEFIERIRRLVKELDIAVPQILIDAKIIIASESFSRSVGVRWQEHIRSESGEAGSAGVFGPGTETLGGGVESSAYSIANTTQGVGAIGFGFGASDRANIKAALDLAEINSYAKTVASPRVVVNNNKSAKIDDAQTLQQLVPSAGLGASTTASSSASLTLSVTPQVTSHGSVQLKGLSITKGSIEAPTPDGTTGTNAKSLTTDVLVDSGGTLVLGGIYQMVKTSGVGGIPLLKDLPFIGQLFRVNSDSSRKDELMVFITPQILDPESAGQTL